MLLVHYLVQLYLLGPRLRLITQARLLTHQLQLTRMMMFILLTGYPILLPLLVTSCTQLVPYHAHLRLLGHQLSLPPQLAIIATYQSPLILMMAYISLMRNRDQAHQVIEAQIMQLVLHPAHQHLLGPILLLMIRLMAQHTLQLQLIQMIGYTSFTTNLEQVTG